MFVCVCVCVCVCVRVFAHSLQSGKLTYGEHVLVCDFQLHVVERIPHLLLTVTVTVTVTVMVLAMVTATVMVIVTHRIV